MRKATYDEFTTQKYFISSLINRLNPKYIFICVQIHLFVYAYLAIQLDTQVCLINGNINP